MRSLPFFLSRCRKNGSRTLTNESRVRYCDSVGLASFSVFAGAAIAGFRRSMWFVVAAVAAV
jgi:hypothetical protein